MEQSLKFLYTRIKKPEYTREQAESKVCQEIFIVKLGSSSYANKKVAFKGGLIIDSLAHGERGYTADMRGGYLRIKDKSLPGGQYITLSGKSINSLPKSQKEQMTHFYILKRSEMK